MTRGNNLRTLQLQRRVNVNRGSCPGPYLWGQQDSALIIKIDVYYMDYRFFRLGTPELGVEIIIQLTLSSP